jgi:4-amino-4-deoxy-L-arabinose transferase-like glycosyltransferase
MLKLILENKNKAFLIILFLVYFITHVFTQSANRPQSVHMWAMCDRASIARNYEQFSMDFFKPRVHESKEGDGITGLEFPIVNYVAAIFYKIFGFNEIWYRLLMLFIFTAGIFCAFKLTSFYIKDLYFRIFAVLTIVLSPVMTYYSANFIPDTASLGLSLIAWYCYFKLQRTSTNWLRFAFVVVISLACLIKVTAAINLVVMLVMALLPYLWKRDSFTKNSNVLLIVVVSAIISSISTIAWYKYAAWLSENFTGGVFLMESRIPKSIEVVKDVFKRVNEVWVEFYFSKTMYMFLAVSILVVVGFIKRTHKELLLVVVGLFCGVVSFSFLMLTQFVSHDYYIITLLPVVFFLAVMFFNLIESFSFNMKKTGFMYLLLSAVIVFSIIFDRRHQEFRMNDHCWMFEWHQYKDYQRVEEYVKSINLKKEDKVVVISDDSPNIALYFLNLRGWSVGLNRDDNAPIESALNYGVKYLILQDTTQLSRPVFANVDIKKIGQFESIKFYSMMKK